MATVTTTAVAELMIFPFTGIIEPNNIQSLAARSVVTAQVDNQSIAASGAGDNQQLQINVDLPSNFAYAVLDFCMSITGVASAGTYNWSQGGSLVLRDALAGANSKVEVPLGLEGGTAAPFDATGDSTMTYKPWCAFKGIIIPLPGDQVRAQTTLFNETANDIAYVVDMYSRFLQFDIAQANDYAVNSPIPTR